MIALFWLSPSNENGLSKTSGIFGKRLCRVTKADIIRDAKLIEDETRAEVQAQQASIQSEVTPDPFPNPLGRRISSSSSESSLPSSIRSPIDKNHYGNTPRNFMYNAISPIRPNFRPGITSSPSKANRNTNCGSSSDVHFRSPNLPYRQPYPQQKVFKSSAVLPNYRGELNSFNATLNDGNAGGILNSTATNSRSNQLNSFQLKFEFQKFKSSVNPDIKLNDNQSDRNSNIVRQTSDCSSSTLLEGLDEDSLFGEF